MQTEDTKAVEEKKQGEHEDTFHSPWEFEPEEWKPITNTERRRILIASLFAFGLIWFGAIMTVSSLCIWWLPTRRYPISSLFEGTWWPAIITSTSAAICSLGVWLMILTYRHAESIGFGGEHEEKSQLAQEGSAEAAEQVGSMASATEEAPPAAITGPTLVGEDKYKIDSVYTEEGHIVERQEVFKDTGDEIDTEVTTRLHKLEEPAPTPQDVRQRRKVA